MFSFAEHHTVERVLDRDAGRMLIFCRECAFADLRNARTLERIWKRDGAPGVQHSGGSKLLGLAVAGSKQEPGEQTDDPPGT